MDALKNVIAVYKGLHEAAPGTDAARRFLNDVASWAVFTLLARLCRGTKPDPQSEREMLGLASIAGIGYRAMGPTWLPDQLSRASQTLAQPNVRERGSLASREWARQHLSEEVLKRAASLQQAGAVTMANRNAANMDGARSEFEAYMRASGSYERGKTVHPADFGPSTNEALAKKIRTSLKGLPAALLAFGDDPTGAVLVQNWVMESEWETLIEGLEPSMDESFVADYELGSGDAEDEANYQRHAAEEQAIRNEVIQRNRLINDRE